MLHLKAKNYNFKNLFLEAYFGISKIDFLNIYENKKILLFQVSRWQVVSTKIIRRKIEFCEKGYHLIDCSFFIILN